MRVLAHILAILFFAASLSLHAASTRFYGLGLARRYTQTNTAAPVLLATKAYESRAFVHAGSVTTASIKKPNNTIVNIPWSGDRAETATFYDVPALLTSAWPLGNYTINLSNPTDGTKASTVYLGGDFYPTAPHVSNFVDAQAIPPGQSFMLRWNPITGSTPTDLLQVRIEEQGSLVFETSGLPGSAGALNGTATSVTIPSNLLPEGRVFSATISVWRAVTRDTTTIPGALGQVGYISRTTLPLRTRYSIQDVVNYGIQKRAIYNQTGSAPVLRNTNPYQLAAFLTASTTQSVTIATFRSPNGSTTGLFGDGTDFRFSQAFATPAAMDGAFPGGGYEMRMTTKNNGLRTNTLPLSGAYPQHPPHVVNIDEAMYIKPASPFTLSWNLIEFQQSDHVQVIVSDGTNTVYRTPIVAGVFGALDGTARSVTFPAGTFVAGKVYLGEIFHARPAAHDFFTYPLARGMSSHARVTRFAMQAASGPTPAPELAQPLRISNQTELTFSSVRGEKYVIYTSTALPVWTATPPITATGPSTVFRLAPNPTPNCFYRIGIAP